MGNIGIDVSKEELAKQCAEWRKLCNEQQKEIQELKQEIEGRKDALATYRVTMGDIKATIREVLSILDLPSHASHNVLITALKELKDDCDTMHTEYELYADDLEMFKLARGDDD